MFKTLSRISACAALAACLFLSSAVRAQDVIVTIPSLNDVQTKVSSVAGKMNSGFPLIVNMTLGQYAAFGIDPGKPVALYANLTENGVSSATFLPIKSQKMFEEQFKAMQEKGSFKNMKVESKDGYAILVSGQDWTEAIPKFDAPKMLNVKMNPQVLVPILEAQLAATELLKDEEEKASKKNSLERLIRNAKQMQEVSFTLDSNEAGDVEAVFSAKPVEGSEIAGNYANTEKLTKSFLGGFFDEKAPFAAQFLGAFDANNRKDLVEAITTNAKIPEELGNVILAAMEVKKFDLACSFYPDEVGVQGVLAMGIANGDKINAAIEKAISEIKPDEVVQGKANAGKIGKSITVHEFTMDREGQAKTFVVAVHPKYLFYAVAPIGTNAVDYLKKMFKEKGLKATEVKQNGLVHFSMEMLAPALKQFGVEKELELTGEVNYVADFTDGQLTGTVKIDGALFESVGKIIAAQAAAAEGDDDEEDELFGDDDDDEAEEK